MIDVNWRDMIGFDKRVKYIAIKERKERAMMMAVDIYQQLIASSSSSASAMMSDEGFHHDK